ncbi:MAG: cytosolic protein [Phycisphaerae bacterium]|nr:cytosolic protein [Phycisphaerae bacterium]
MECKKERNEEFCKCTYSSCGRRAVCCDCLRYHLASRQLPGCCFPPEAERTYDRSFEAFAKAWKL